MTDNKLRVGVLGAGRWANMAHIPGWLRDPRVEVVALCDVELPLARKMASNLRHIRSHRRLADPRLPRRRGRHRHRHPLQHPP